MGELETKCARFVGLFEEQRAAFEAKYPTMIQHMDGQTELTQNENTQLSTRIEELAKSFAQDISKTASNSEKMVTELKKDVNVALKQLERSIHEHLSVSVHSAPQDTNSSLECLKADIERKLDDIRNTSVAERARIVKSLEGERT